MCLSNIYRNIKFIVLCLSLAFLVGCATPARHTQMVVTRDEINTAAHKPNPLFVNNIAIEKLTGGKQTNPLWTSQVDNEGFSRALEDSLANVGYLNPELSAARFKLKVALEELKQPFAGIDLKVICQANYALYDSKLKKLIFEKTLTTPYTATFSSAFVAGERLKLANEGAVKENIKHFLQALNSLRNKEGK